MKMTSIYDIPYKDIQIFLLANNINIQNNKQDYNKTMILLNDKKAKGHTTSIIEWILAHNLLINNVDIPYYTINQIDDMSQNDINQLAKLLNMKGNNTQNIKNILRYLHKLYVSLPEIHDIIFKNLSDLEINDIDIYSLNFDNIISLLKTHRNKKDIRKFISDNISKIIVYISLELNITELLTDISNELLKGSLDDVLFDVFEWTDFNNKNIMIEIIKDYNPKLLEHYNDKEIKDFIKEIEEKDDTEYITRISKIKMYELNNFTFDLISIHEIGLARQFFNIINNFIYSDRVNSYNRFLIKRLIYINDIKALKNIINFMGENSFSDHFAGIIATTEMPKTIINFLENLTKLEEYNVLLNFLKEFRDTISNTNKRKIINRILQNVVDAINTKNNEHIFDYINQIYEYMPHEQ